MASEFDSPLSIITAPGDPGPRDGGATPVFTPMSDEVAQMAKAAQVRQLFQRARDARRPLVVQWKKNYRALNNRVWGPRAEPWLPAPEIANIWPLVGSFVAWMTDQRPGIEVTPTAPPFSTFSDFYDRVAEDMGAILDAGFAVNQLDAEIERLLWDVSTYGVGYLKTTWEPWLADGKGDSAFRRVDPFTIYPDPNARNMQDANYIVEAKIMSREDLDRAFPGSMNKIPDTGSEDIDTAPVKTDEARSMNAPRLSLAAITGSANGQTAPVNSDSRFGNSPRDRSTLISEDPVVVVLEAWIRTHAVLTHADDDNIAEGTARVVDRWKCLVICGNTVLMDEWADDIYGFPTHPYSKMVMFDTGDWYGPSIVQFLISPQESVNRLLASMEQNIQLIGNPIMMESPRNNVGGRTTITNRPGQRLNAAPGEIAWLDPPQIHPEIVNLIAYYESKMESISGLSAIMRGFTTTGRNSTDVVSSLQDSAFVRVRATLRNLERCLRDACEKQCANIAEFYTEPRLLSITGPDGESTALALKARHFYTLPDAEDDQVTPLRFSLRADAGSDHPTSRQARQSQAERLYAMGAIDDIEVLKAERWPNWPQVAARVMNAKALAGQLGHPPGARASTRAQ